jgi:hypothetical protein
MRRTAAGGAAASHSRALLGSGQAGNYRIGFARALPPLALARLGRVVSLGPDRVLSSELAFGPGFWEVWHQNTAPLLRTAHLLAIS